MFDLIISLIPLALAAALQPPQLIALVVLMQTRQGLANGWSYVAGMTVFRLLIGIAFWVLISGIESAIEQAGGAFDIFVGAVLVVLGLLMLIYALRQGLAASDEDEAAASWLEKLSSVTPLQAALVGIAFIALDPKDWLIDISVVDLIAAADLSSMQSFLAYLAYLLMAQLLLVIPLILAMVTPQRAKVLLDTLNIWLNRHERVITFLVMVLLGGVFLFAGLEHLAII